MTGAGTARIMVALVLAVHAVECCGFGGSVIKLPARVPNAPKPVLFSPLSGFSVSVDTRWFNAGGYRPVRVRFNRATPATSDRKLSIELRLMPTNRDSQVVTTGKSLTLSAGETAAEMVVLCPMDNRPDLINWSVRVNDVEDPSLSAKAWFNMAAPGPTEGLRVVRPFVDGAVPVRLVQRYRSPRQNFGGRQQLRTDIVESEPLDDWLGYSAVDVLLLDLIDLRDLAEKQPERVRTVRRWMLAGGTVWVEGVADTPEGYLEADRLLGISTWRHAAIEAEHEPEEEPAPDLVAPSEPKEAPASETGDPLEPEEESEAENGKVLRKQILPIDGAAGWGYEQIDGTRGPRGRGPQGRGPRGMREGPQRLRDNPFVPRGGETSTRGWYATRQVGFGRVMAFHSTYASMPDAMRFGQGEVVRRTWFQHAWAARHGIEPGGSCPQFGNLLIPGVGVAPITEFQFLITLFVLTIGPLNYWLLWRRQQLQMLVVTVPLCAMAVTLGLVAYAAVADGFGVQARARSVTLLNQTTGEATSWSRVSHYAAMSPEEPPVLPDDCAVYPITPAWEAAMAPAGGRRQIDWSESGQTLISGWIPSRTPVQHLVIRCRESPAKLVFKEEGDKLEVTNQLGAPIDTLLVRGADGEWLSGSELDPGEPISLDPITRREAIQAYRVLAIENEPTFPIGAGKAVEQTLERLGNPRAARQMQRGFASVNLIDNLGEQMLASVSGLRGGRSLNFPPRTYVAVTSQAVETPVGWDSVEEVGSFHVIVGRW